MVEDGGRANAVFSAIAEVEGIASLANPIADKLLADAPGLGWSSADHPGHVLSKRR